MSLKKMIVIIVAAAISAVVATLIAKALGVETTRQPSVVQLVERSVEQLLSN